ncbi:MAG: MBOAT family O-acyltransferase [Halioglobus sp.]
MLFNSAEYLFFFLPITVLVFQILSRASSTERQITWLVFASLFFYASWKPEYLLLILSSIIVNFLLGKKLARPGLGKALPWLLLGVCFNLGLLGYFKYTGFFIEGLNAIGIWLIPIPEITLPLAISFFTFQQIAYLVDVSRKDCKEYQFRHYMLFVLFFPQLIAGPIVHHKEMMPQFNTQRLRADISTDFAVGITFIAVGLFKKVVMADSLALIADPLFSASSPNVQLNTIDALLAGFAFSFQIYFDFSGYSDIAIGSARLFGIKLPENFRSPYKSRSIIEMWQRWHMTLSRFLRDYLYFSLGGNRLGAVKRYRNLVITMVLGGLWHGAAWTFVVWGALHGMFLCLNHFWRALTRRAGLEEFFKAALLQPLFILLTFTAWTIALIVFRADDLPSSWAIIQSAFLDINFSQPLVLEGMLEDGVLQRLLSFVRAPTGTYSTISITMLVAAIICWALPNTQELLIKYDPVIAPDNDPIKPSTLIWQPTLAYAVVTALLLAFSLMSLSSITRFIYFQF